MATTTRNPDEPVPEVEPSAEGVLECADLPAEPKKKKRYTRNLRPIQQLEVGVSKSHLRLAKAVTRGLNEWIDATETSARKRRDGGIKDSLKNSNKAMRKALRTAVQAPADFIDEVCKIKRPF